MAMLASSSDAQTDPARLMSDSDNHVFDNDDYYDEDEFDDDDDDKEWREGQFRVTHV